MSVHKLVSGSALLCQTVAVPLTSNPGTDAPADATAEQPGLPPAPWTGCCWCVTVSWARSALVKMATRWLCFISILQMTGPLKQCMLLSASSCLWQPPPSEPAAAAASSATYLALTDARRRMHRNVAMQLSMLLTQSLGSAIGWQQSLPCTECCAVCLRTLIQIRAAAATHTDRVCHRMQCLVWEPCQSCVHVL